MSDLSEKTKIPIGWAATILGAIVGLVFQAGVSLTRFSSLDKEFSRHMASEESSRAKGLEMELRVQRLEIMLGEIDEKLERIDKKLDALGHGDK